jgi:putative phosphoesterase
MKLGILSDIHDQVWNLAAILPALADCDVMLCCGDLCSPFIVDQLARGFARDIHIVFGNNDADTFRMTAKLGKYPQVRLAGELFTGEFGGRRVAMNHFDAIARPVIASGQFDLVCFGHNHVFELTRVGGTLAVNPGSVMGMQLDAEARQTYVRPTFVIYDTTAHAAQGFELHSDGRVTVK